MKKIMMFGIVLVALSLCTSLQAQKFGHLNSGNLLQALPEVKAADSQLSVFRDQLIKKGEDMAKVFQTKLEDYLKKAESGELSKVQMQEQENALQKERETIMNYEQEVIAKVQQKRQELLNPILQKVETAIQAVGKEGAYTFIFDTSLINTILFASESDDVEPLVRKKLGL
jgi:outer membrane protein